MAAKGEKLGGDPQINQPTVWFLCRGPYFSGVVGSVQLYQGSVKGCHIRLVMSAYVSFVSGFSYMMYIDLNHRDSWI
jgi:hypothetical protein